MAIYSIYGIGKTLGYYRVDFEYNDSENNIMSIAKEKFNHTDTVYSLVSLRKDKDFINGIKRAFLIDYKTQERLAQITMWGYTSSFNDYSKLLREICLNNAITTNIKDDYIKYFYTNKVASICPNSNEMKIFYSTFALIYFLDKVYDGDEIAETNLVDELKSLIKKKVKVQLDYIRQNYPNISNSDYTIDEDTSGKYIKTHYMKVYLIDDILSKNIQLFHNDNYIGTIKQDEL